MQQLRAFGLTALALLLAAGAAQAQPGGTASVRLRAFDEVPALSTPGGGRFDAVISEDGETMDYELSYFNLEGTVTQAHLHLGQKGVNGGIIIFLCSNLGNGPVGTQECPADPAEISGTIHASDVIGANAQGLAPGELFAALRGIRAGVVYVNVHTTLFPGGEIRGQLRFTPSPEE
jgi:hypothetical protein